MVPTFSFPPDRATHNPATDTVDAPFRYGDQRGIVRVPRHLLGPPSATPAELVRAYHLIAAQFESAAMRLHREGLVSDQGVIVVRRRHLRTE